MLVRKDEKTYNPQYKSPIGKLQYHYALLYQQYKANKIMKYLYTLPEVRTCSLYGSLANGNADKYSDIDIDSFSEESRLINELKVKLAQKGISTTSILGKIKEQLIGNINTLNCKIGIAK